MYADIEALLVPEVTVGRDPTKSGTTVLKHHRPCSAGYIIVSNDVNYNMEPKIFFGPHCIRHFLDSLNKDYLQLKEIIDHPLEMKMSSEQRRTYESSNRCWICEKEIGDGEIKVADHCHLTGSFRGAAHQSCNLNYRLKKSQFKLPVFFHNLKGYDAHMII